MTANDIANMVEKEPYHTNLNRITIANFIRQQQAEIETLKQSNFDGNNKVNLELTDEEIMDCIEDKTGYSFNACDEDLLDFARAILIKAQEK